MSREHEAELRAVQADAAARVSDLEAALSSARAQAAAAVASLAGKDQEDQEGRMASLRRIAELQLAVEVGDRAMGDLRANAGQVATRLQQVSVDGCVKAKVCHIFHVWATSVPTQHGLSDLICLPFHKSYSGAG